MKKVKVVSGFFNNMALAHKVVLAQARIAKKCGMEVSIRVENAYSLYMNDEFFRCKIVKSGRPQPGQLIVVVYYVDSVSTVIENQIEVVEKPVAVKSPVRIPLKKSHVLFISAPAMRSKALLIKLSVKNNTCIVINNSKTIPLPMQNFFLRAA